MNCPFFRFQEKRYPGHEVTSGQRSTLGAQAHIAWCTHAQSPVTQEDTRTIGGATKLRCGGDTAQCQLPTGQP